MVRQYKWSKKLTPRQAEILGWIIKHRERHGLMPTMPEIAVGMGIGTQQGAREVLRVIERKGYVSRKPNAARGITILKNPDDTPYRNSKERLRSDSHKLFGDIHVRAEKASKSAINPVATKEIGDIIDLSQKGSNLTKPKENPDGKRKTTP